MPRRVRDSGAIGNPVARITLSPLGKRRLAQLSGVQATLPATAYVTEAVLLVDELVSMLIVQAVRNPEGLNPADFSFAQKCQLLRALYDSAFEGWLYHALPLLDAARQKWTQRFSEQVTEEPLRRFLAVANSVTDAARKPGVTGPLFNAAILRIVQALRRGLPAAEL